MTIRGRLAAGNGDRPPRRPRSFDRSDQLVAGSSASPLRRCCRSRGDRCWTRDRPSWPPAPRGW